MGQYKGDIYGRVKAIPKGGSISVPLDRWNAARSAAFRVGKIYKCRFSVHRKEDEVVISRVEIPYYRNESVVRGDIDSLEVMEKITFDNEAEWRIYATAAYNMNGEPRYGKRFCASRRGGFTVSRLR